MGSCESERQREARLDPEPNREEVRLALALNGGVSLAVWMGGCSTELDRARRARAAASDGRSAYDTLCECFGRRLVIDILTGSSAGGVNGALLSAAMVKGRGLEPDFVRERWLDLGDLSRLLHPTTEPGPRSLMQGELFHTDLLKTFKQILGVEQGDAQAKEVRGPVSVPSLDITMTDVIGVERRFKDGWGNDLVAREHRPRFQFRKRAEFTAEALAAAARTSASFPFAFEPWPVTGEARRLAGLTTPTYGVDGGLLDNAPIKAALEAIPSKPASSRVVRYLCYMNGDPQQPEQDSLSGPPEPSLLDVGGYAFSLPREAPFVDHLHAIQRAVQRPSLAGGVQRQLLTLDLDVLRPVAEALFDAYLERRTTQSLEELLEEPSDALVANEVLAETGGSLPWIPASLAPVDDDGQWQWGTHTAKRILHLLIDLLRTALEEGEGKTEPDERRKLLRWRIRLDGELRKLDAASERIAEGAGESESPPGEEDRPIDRLAKAATATAAERTMAYAAVKVGAEVVFEALTTHPGCFNNVKTTNLFKSWNGESRLSEGLLQDFFERVLSIEVVRRTFASDLNVESAEPLRFVQLTPTAPSPIFTAMPLSVPLPTSAESKLTGIGLGHFAGFYRRAWRANDFMWGRLDAAARVVDLLLNAPSSEVGVGSAKPGCDIASTRAAFLSERLLEAYAGDDEWLLHELLEDAERVDADRASGPKRPDSEPTSFEKAVEQRILIELCGVRKGKKASLADLPFIRTAFQRLAQLEVVRDELPVIQDESKKDRELGSSTDPLRLGDPKAPESLRPRLEVESVRLLYEDDKSLPGRLIERGEAVSDLGLRTMTHASFVGLSAARTAGVPLAALFGIVRTPLLAIAGSVSREWFNRVALLLGFWAAAIYLTTRLVTSAGGDPAFKDFWSWATLTALAAGLVVAGTATVPFVRALHRVGTWRNFGAGLALLAVGGGAAAVLAISSDDFGSVEALLFPPGAETPPNEVLITVLALLGVLSLARISLPGPIPKQLKRSAIRLAQGLPLATLLSTAGVLLAAYSVPDLLDYLGGETWKAAAAYVALAGPPVAAGFAFALALWHRQSRPTATPPD